MLFICVILHTMSLGKSMQLLCILPFGMLSWSAISMMFVKSMLAVCILVSMVYLQPCPSTLYSIHLFAQSASHDHTVAYTTSNDSCDRLQNILLNASFVLLSFMEIPHIYLIICISALSNCNPTSTSKGMVSLPCHKSCCYLHYWYPPDLSCPVGELWMSEIAKAHRNSSIHL